jgi:hypothetical protein
MGVGAGGWANLDQDLMKGSEADRRWTDFVFGAQEEDGDGGGLRRAAPEIDEHVQALLDGDSCVGVWVCGCMGVGVCIGGGVKVTCVWYTAWKRQWVLFLRLTAPCRLLLCVCVCVCVCLRVQERTQTLQRSQRCCVKPPSFQELPTTRPKGRIAKD